MPYEIIKTKLIFQESIMKTAKELIHKWHEVVKGDDPELLDKLLAENAVFCW